MAPSPFQTALLFLTTTIFTTFVAGAALKNITLTVPDGATNHGNPNLLCTPTTASNIIIFYLGNYVAHAATVVTLPGEKMQGVLVTVILSLLFPLSGIMRGLDAINYRAQIGKNGLRKAARAGALCMVIRSNTWKPVDGDRLPIGFLSIIRDNSEIETDQLEASTSLHVVNIPSVVKNRTIHGSHTLSKDYELAFVPRDASFSESTEQSSLPCGYSATKVLVALGQSIYASSTIYSARGDQIARYGYAAFGLTVAPFAIMSIINLLGNLMTPTYPAMYMVRSSIMIEAQKRPDCNFEGVIGTLNEESTAEIDPYFPIGPRSYSLCPSRPPKLKTLRVTFSQSTDGCTIPSSFLVRPNEWAASTRCFIGIPSQPLLARKSLSNDGYGNKRNTRLVYGLSLFVIAIQFAIIGGLTRFHGGQSTHAQKSWIITWFVFGIAYGFILDLVRQQTTLPGRRMKWWGLASLFRWFSPAPAIGGFVVVGQMLSSFGSCVQIS